MRKPRINMDADALAYASLVRLGRNKKKLKALSDYIKLIKDSGHWDNLKAIYPIFNKWN